MDKLSFLDRYLQPFTKEHRRLKERAYELGVLVIEDEVAEFLSVYLQDKTVTCMVEVGTGLGYSAKLFRKLFREAEIHSVDRSPERYQMARRILKEDDIHLHFGDAVEFLTHFDKPIDFLFLDGAKSQYKAMLESCEDQLSDQAIIITDNIFLRGKAYEEVEKRHRTVKRRMQEYLEKMFRDYDSHLLDLGDGLLVSRKKWLNY